MKAVIYARYSTENQDARSIEDQERRCRVFAVARGLQVVDVYSDAAVSGTTTARPNLQRLLVDARARKFKAVVVDDLSRLSRDRTDSAVLIRQLDDLGIQVVDAETGATSDDEASDVVFAVKGIVNAEYVKAIRRQTHRGLEGRAIAGFHTGGKTYGYSSVAEPNPADPTKPRRVPVVDLVEAALVVRIFELFASGQSPRQIAQALNADHVPAPHDNGRGNKGASGWSHTTIRAMLRNRRYRGELMWNASKWKKTAKGTRRRVARPDADRIVKNVPELAIVGEDLWQRVQNRLGSSQRFFDPDRRGRTPRTSRTFALSGLLRCGECGGNFGIVGQAKRAGKVYRTLGCSAHKDHRCANARTISERKVVNTLTSYLRERLSRPDRVRTFVAAFEAKFSQLDAAESPAKVLEAQVEKQRQLVSNVQQALVACPSSTSLPERLAVEERKLGQLQDQLRTIVTARPKVLPLPTAIARYVTELAQTLESDDPGAAGDVLRRALAPFRMLAEGTGYRMTGALDLGVCSEKVAGA